jgi:hypothetical protein
MFKTAAQTALVALSLLSFGTGCDLADLADVINNIGNGGGQVDPQPEPIPEPPILDCDLQLDQCLNGLGYDDTMEPVWDPAIDDCYTAYGECMGEPVPEPEPWPVDTCELALDDCLAGIYSGDPNDPTILPYPVPDYDPTAEQACFDAYDDCVGNEPPPPPPYGQCEIALDDCLEDVYGGFDDPTFPNDDDALFPYDPAAEQACFDAYDTCVGIDPDPWPVDPCDEQFMVCLDSGIDPLVCEIEALACWGIEPPPPPVDACTQLFDDCVDNGVSPGLCQQVLDECIVNQEPCDLPGYPGGPGDDDDDDDGDVTMPVPMP